jgi:hypothetical protein
MRFAAVVGVLVGLSFLAACRSDSNTRPDGGGGTPGVDSGKPPTRIQDIQDDDMPEGTVVELRGVIVTAIDTYGNRQNDFWVQDPAGGERSGLHVFNAPAAVVRTLARGDVVDITGGVKQEFAPRGDMSGRTVTEVGPPSAGAMLQVTRTGTTTVPAPVVVDALPIGQKATRQERDAEWEKWEGVLITLTNIRQFNEASEVPSASNPDSTLQLFSVTGEMFLESGLAAFPATGLATGTCIASATGVLDYIVNWFVLHRDPADIVVGGTGCAPPEDSEAACTDTLDNDGNTFEDCVDNKCVLGHSGCRTVKSITDVQTTMTAGAVELVGATVTVLSRNKKNLWISTDGAAAPNQGVFVFGTGADLDAAIVVGSKVTVIGTVSESNNDDSGDTVTQIRALQITPVEGDLATVTPIVDPDPSQLIVKATGEPFESVLVTFTNVKVTVLGNPNTGGNFGVGELQVGTTKFLIDDDIILLTDAVGTCYASITGIWTYQVFNNAYGLYPTAAPTPVACP